MADKMAIDWAAPLREQPEYTDEPQSDIDWGAPLRAQQGFDAQFEQAPPEEDEGVTAADLGVSAMQGFAGVAGGVSSMAEYAGQQTGIDWLADFGTGGRRAAEEAQEWWGQHYSEGAKEAQSKQWATTGPDAAWKDPGAWALGVSGSAPYLLTSLIPGTALAKVGASAKAIAAASAAVGGIQVGGEAHSSIANEIDGYSDEQMMMIPGVAEAIEGGANMEDVRMYLIEEATRYATPIATGIGVVSGGVGGPIESALLARQSGRSMMGRMGVGGLTEATQESVESGIAETMTPNVAMGRDPMEGVAEATVSGAALGFGTGAPLGLAGGAPDATPTQTGDVDQTTYDTAPIIPDQPSPEPTAYLMRQVELLDSDARDAVLVTPGAYLDEVDSNKYEVVEVAPDTEVVVRKGDEATADRIREAYATGDNATIQEVLGDVLGYGTVGKVDTNEVLTVRNADGEVVYDAVYDGSQTAVDAANRAVSALGEGATVQIRSTEDAVTEREIAYYNEQQPEVEPVQPETPESVVPEQGQPVQPAPETPVQTTAEERPQQPAAQTVAPAPQPAVSAPTSPLSLTPIPNDENVAMQSVAEIYTSTVNQAANIPRGKQTETKAQLADDLIGSMIAYYNNLREEGYNVTGFHKIFTPVLGRVSMKNLLAGNYTPVSDRILKKIGGELTPEMEASISDGEIVGGRKSGRFTGKVTGKQFDKFLKNVKEFIDKANEDRQSKRATPATSRAEAAKQVSKVRSEPKKQAEKPQQEKLAEPQEKAKAEPKQPVKEEEKVAPAPTQEAKAEPQVVKPTKKPKPLKSIMVDVPVTVEETGELSTMPDTAENALAFEAERIGRLKQLVGCLLA